MIGERRRGLDPLELLLLVVLAVSLAGFSPPGAVVYQAEWVDAAGESVAVAEPIELVLPTFTEIAWKARVSGMLVARATVDETGTVSSVRIVKGLPLGLEERASEALRHWRFEPADQAREVAAMFEFLRLGPSAVESSATDGLRAWLQRLELLDTNVASPAGCWYFTDLDRESQRLVAGQPDAVTVFEDFTNSSNPTVALVSRLRVGEAAGRDQRWVELEKLTSNHRRAACDAGSALAQELTRDARRASPWLWLELRAAARAAGVAELPEVVWVHGDFAFGSVGERTLARRRTNVATLGALSKTSTSEFSFSTQGEFAISCGTTTRTPQFYVRTGKTWSLVCSGDPAQSG
jgi:TonB family protein